MTDDLSRIHRFEREIELAGGDYLDSPLGYGMVTAELPLRHDSNYFFLDRPAEADEAIAEADRVLGGAGRTNRVIITFDADLGGRLRPEFDARGWRTMRHVFMAQRRPPDKTADLSIVQEVDQAALRPGRRRAILSYPWGTPTLAEELLDSKIHLGKRAVTRFFGVPVDGEIVAWTDLYVAQGVAQIEDVATLPEHRGKGYATAVVLRAVEEGRAEGADLVFLVADGEDWPRQLYARLGFDELAPLYKFVAP